MDRLQKFIRNLDAAMRLRIERVTLLILRNDLETLDIVPMKGTQDIFRCRIGDVRIIFRKAPKENRILDIDFRGNIYKRW